MAARTFTSAGVNNLWSNAANWDGGVAVPADNDSVTIPANQTCIFDVDTSGFANGIAGITVTGTLSVSTTTSSYMNMKAATAISGAGTFNVGTSGSPIPFAVKFTLTGGSGWYVQGSGGLTMNVYGASPTYKYAKLTGAESAGSTRLEIDTDLTGDVWANADSVRIDNIAKAQNSELRTIGAITSTYIDITAGLTSSKLVGSYVILITRNVTIIGVSGSVLQNFSSGKLVINEGSFETNTRTFIFSTIGAIISGGVFSKNDRVISTCNGITITNGIFSGNSTGAYLCNNITISGGIFSGNIYVLQNCFGITISGGIFSGNTNGLIFCIGATISGGTFSDSTNGIYQSSAKITDATFSSNTYDINQSQFIAHDTALGSTTEVYQYATLSRETYSESINHDQSAGAFKSWTKGGVTTSVATPVPTGLTRSYQLALENASVEGFFNRRVNVPVGKTITLKLYLRKSASMTYLPRVWVHKYGDEPFTTAGDILHTFTMTNSTDTWETDTYSYTNTGDYDIELECRFVGMNADGYVYGQVTDTFAGGGVSKSRILGGV